MTVEKGDPEVDVKPKPGDRQSHNSYQKNI
ncbi:unnamed protein product [Acanthoscelides obtectus]|uniref:Uncharacterized protein n=1 Tax=Acanthoscelides obtectus TaxID=200917 RepID=A0A9P0LIJ2_ACAOB|nr:unnamed protein product [Acanthoscelides obtectus]CAK1664194.1 hypothetical protein AOBTE_LOCUS24114 [Acanthoscelides obtectus]